MGFADIFKYFGIAMAAAEAAASAYREYEKATAPDSPGGSEITDTELKLLVEGLDDDFGSAVTGILQGLGLPVQSVKVEIKMF